MAIMQTVASWFGYAPRDPVDGKQHSNKPINTVKPVTFDTAMTVSAVYASIRLLAETISTMPLDLYHKDADGNLGDKGHHQKHNNP